MADLHPAEQGAYDYLCAIYAIVNARRWLNGRAQNADSIFDAYCLTLYRRLITEAAIRTPPLDLLMRGSSPDEVDRLIAVSGLRTSDARTPAALDQHMQPATACAILHFTYRFETNRPDHYSLLIRHDGREALLDSYQFALERRDGWLLRFTEATGLPQGAQIRRCWLVLQP